MDKKLDSGQKIGQWTKNWTVDKKLNNGQCAKNRTLESSGQWTLNTIDSIENVQKIGQSLADSNWTVSVGKKLKMQRKLITRISLTLIADNNFSVSKLTVHYLLSTVQFFCLKTFSSSFSEDSGQWTKTVNPSPGQGGTLVP